MLVGNNSNDNSASGTGKNIIIAILELVLVFQLRSYM